MNCLSLSIMLTALITAIACVLPGVFMVLRGVSLMSDAISHAILLGIVLMFFYVHNLNSPLLIIGAAGAGFVTVLVTEALINTACLKKDAAIGLVFPLFFSIAVVLISMYTRDIHLDMDMVLLGELAFVPFNRLIISNIDVGPIALWVMAGIALVNAIFIGLFYKELQIGVFDPIQAHLSGCAPTKLYYGLMSIVSITAVGAFDVVGSIVVVALMITPAATAFLISFTLSRMIVISLTVGAFSALGGYALAWCFDVSIAGSIAVVSGIICGMVVIGAPRTGLYTHYMRSRGVRNQLYSDILCAYIANEGTSSGDNIDGIAAELGWDRAFLDRLLADAVGRGMLICSASSIDLTDKGMNRVAEMKR